MRSNESLAKTVKRKLPKGRTHWAGVPIKRKFDGKIFKTAVRKPKKADAKDFCEWAKKKGIFKAYRIVKHGRWYYIYTWGVK